MNRTIAILMMIFGITIQIALITQAKTSIDNLSEAKSINNDTQAWIEHKFQCGEIPQDITDSLIVELRVMNMFLEGDYSQKKESELRKLVFN